MGDIEPGGAFIFHGANGDHQVADLDSGVQGGAAADADQGLGTNIYQLLSGDGGGGATHAGGGDANPDALVMAGKGPVLPVIGL